VDEIRSVEELRALVGEPMPRVVAKDRDRLHPEHVEWLGASPLCLVATSATDGTCDVSPKGDPPGSLVHIVDDRTLALAERPGNKRTDGFVNLLTNPHIGLLFLVPGRGDTLRINGTARLLRGGSVPYAESMVVKGHRPQVVVEVSVEQVFFHCAKAFLRSQLWQPETWDPDAIPSRAEIAHSLERPEDSLAELEAYYGEQYAAGLY
jgi:PPOX class probable FMN-dependent enzyme